MNQVKIFEYSDLDGHDHTFPEDQFKAFILSPSINPISIAICPVPGIDYPSIYLIYERLTR